LSLGSSHADSALLVASVFAGSMLWWLFLCGALTKLRTRLTPAWIARIDLLSGGVILAMAAVSILSGLR
jgi:putative LysE/RhtB family amino acid efflux pump